MKDTPFLLLKVLEARRVILWFPQLELGSTSDNATGGSIQGKGSG
jgi:hypothetical protein